MSEAQRIRIGIVGASGYSGMELLRILAGHPNVSITYLAGSHDTKREWTEVFPHLDLQGGLCIHKYDADECSDRCDCVFVALPSGVSGVIAVELWQRGLKVIDLSGDLRLEADIYTAWYGKQPIDATAQAQAVYGLCEWNREQIPTASLISNPGCYATSILLALLPIVEAGLVDAERPIIIDAKSGVSGAGKGPALNTSFSELSGNFYPYKVGRHQHTPEIEKWVSKYASQKGLNLQPILLTTQLLPVVRGIYATHYVSLQPSVDVMMALEVFSRRYSSEPFVRVVESGRIPELKHVCGTNRCHIGLYLDERTRLLQVFSVIDNLQKGAAGQAVQNFNLLYGFPEDTSLRSQGMVP